MSRPQDSMPTHTVIISGHATPELDDKIAPGAVVDSSHPPVVVQINFLKQIFSFPAMLGGLLVTGVFVARHNFEVDPDLWWHLKVGENILATHHWPTTDPYSFTAVGQPWLASEWLGDVLFAAVERFAGLRGLQALLIALGAAVMLALYAYATLRSKNSKAGFIAATVLLALAAANFNLRPQMLGYFFLVLTLIALERLRQGNSAALWFLPLLFLAWINTHGSWEIGLGTLLVYWLCGLWDFRVGAIEMHAWKSNERAQLSLVFVLCLAALAITPYGVRLAAYPFRYLFSLPLNLAHIDEWRFIAFNSFGPYLFLALVLGVMVTQILFQITWRVQDLVLFFGATAMAFIHARFLLIFVPVFAPLLAGGVSSWVRGYDSEKDHYVLNALMLAAMLAAMIHYFPTRAQIEKNIALQFPADAANFLRQSSVPGELFNSYAFGGYLLYSVNDLHKVFIDGRGDLYEPAGVFSDYLHVVQIKPGLLSVLRNYDVQACLVERDNPLAVFLAAQADWKTVYSDKLSVLLVRQHQASGHALNAVAKPARKMVGMK
jgi:hypothetical protein